MRPPWQTDQDLTRNCLLPSERDTIGATRDWIGKYLVGGHPLGGKHGGPIGIKKVAKAVIAKGETKNGETVQAAARPTRSPRPLRPSGHASVDADQSR